MESVPFEKAAGGSPPAADTLADEPVKQNDCHICRTAESPQMYEIPDDSEIFLRTKWGEFSSKTNFVFYGKPFRGQSHLTTLLPDVKSFKIPRGDELSGKDRLDALLKHAFGFRVNAFPLYGVPGEVMGWEFLPENRARWIEGSGGTFVILTTFDGVIHRIEIPPKSYNVPSRNCGIDHEGYLRKPPEYAASIRLFRSNANIFGSNERGMQQWEYDRYVYENSRPGSQYASFFTKSHGNIIVWEHVMRYLEHVIDRL